MKRDTSVSDTSTSESQIPTPKFDQVAEEKEPVLVDETEKTVDADAVAEQEPEMAAFPEEAKKQQMRPNDWIRNRKAPSKLMKAVLKKDNAPAVKKPKDAREMRPNDWLRERKAPSKLVRAVIQKEAQPDLKKGNEKRMAPNDWLRQKNVPDGLIRAVMRQKEVRADRLQTPLKKQPGIEATWEKPQQPTREEVRQALEDLIIMTMKAQPRSMKIEPQNYDDQQIEEKRNWDDIDWEQQKQAIETLATALFEIPLPQHWDDEQWERKDYPDEWPEEPWDYRREINSLNDWVPVEAKMESLKTLLEQVRAAESKEIQPESRTDLTEPDTQPTQPTLPLPEQERTFMQHLQIKAGYLLQQQDSLDLNKFEKSGTMIICVGQILLLLLFIGLLIGTLSSPTLSDRGNKLVSSEFKETLGKVKTQCGILLFFSLSLLILSGQGVVGLILNRHFLFRVYAASTIVYMLYSSGMVSLIVLVRTSHVKAGMEELLTRPSTMAALKCCGVNDIDDILRYKELNFVHKWKLQCMEKNRKCQISHTNSTIWAMFQRVNWPPEEAFKRCSYPDECCEKFVNISKQVGGKLTSCEDCPEFFQNGCNGALRMDSLFVPYIVTTGMMLMVSCVAVLLTVIAIPLKHQSFVIS